MDLKINEYDIQEWLSFILNGRREKIINNIGRVDIVVSDDETDFLIEVKKCSDWKHSIGQILAYKKNFKTNKEIVSIIALYDFKSYNNNTFSKISELCYEHNIIPWYIDKNFLYFIYNLEKTNCYLGKDKKNSRFFLQQFVYNRLKSDEKLRFINKMRIKRDSYFSDINTTFKKMKLEEQDNIFIIKDEDSNSEDSNSEDSNN